MSGTAAGRLSPALERHAATVSPGRGAARRAIAVDAAIGVVGLGALLLAAAVLYAPYRPLPFEPTDFGEILPRLRGRTFVDRFSDLFAYYVGHGRFFPLSVALWNAKWSAFGWNVVGWQLSTFLTMGAVVVCVFLLLRRLGSSAAGALAGASLFVVGQPAAIGWLRVHLSEPLGLLFLLPACILAAGRAEAVEPSVRRDVAIAALVLAALLTKETFVAAVPFVVVLGLARRSDGLLFAWPLARADRRFLTALFGAVVLVAVPVLAALSSRTETAYAAHYGIEGAGIERLLDRIAIMALPFPGAPLAPANLALITLLVAGWSVALQRPADRRRRARTLMLGTVLTLAGALVYLPWPGDNALYGLPFQLGSALLLGVAVSALAERSVFGRVLAFLLVSALLLAAGRSAHRTARHFDSQRQLAWALVHELPTPASVDSIVFANDSSAYPIYSGRLWLYAVAVRGPENVARFTEAPCDTVLARSARPRERTAYVATLLDCGGLGLAHPDVSVTSRHRFLSFGRLRVMPDSLHAELRLPAAAGDDGQSGTGPPLGEARR